MESSEFLLFFTKIEQYIFDLDTREAPHKKFLSSAKSLRNRDVISYDLYKELILVFDQRLKLLENPNITCSSELREQCDKVLQDLWRVKRDS